MDALKGLFRRLRFRSSDLRTLWAQADLELSNGNQLRASKIYRRLASGSLDRPEAYFFAGLAAERLNQPSEAIATLEAGLDQYPNLPLIFDQYVRVSFELDQIDRVIRHLVINLEDARRACKQLFDQFPHPQLQSKLIDYCLRNGLTDLVGSRVEFLLNNSDDYALIWSISDILLVHKCDDEAKLIYRRLAMCPAETPQKCLYRALSEYRLGNVNRAAEIFEVGIQEFPEAAELIELYTRICAEQLGYQRYHDFMASREAAGLSSPVSILDFCRVSMRAPIEFVISLQDIALQMDHSDLPILTRDFHTYLRENPQSIEVAKALVFFCCYLDLPEDFRAGVYEALRIVFESNDHARLSLQILYELTPPVIPRHANQSEIDIRGFIEAAISIAENPIALNEPIADMTDVWVPWQSIFCLNEPKLYGKAIEAFQKLALSTWPKLKFVAEHIANAVDVQKRADRKIRVGFIVHDSMPMMSGFLPRLDKEQFETIYLRPGKAGKSAAAKGWIARAGKVVQYSDVDMYAAIKTIADEELDIIVSGPSIAAVFYPLMARLAPLQMVLLEPNWTNGLNHADYYISWQPAEPANPSDFYNTKVSLFQHPPYWIERPESGEKGPIDLESRTKIRRRLLKVGPETRIYLCANTPPKIHPEMDGIFHEILERDKDAILVLLRGEYPPAKTLRSRLRERLGSNYKRVVFLSTLNKDDAHLLLQSVDCCLDSYPLCGMSSSFDGAMLGIPTVTLPVDIPFGRWTAAIYEYIGATSLIAKSREDYVDKALRLASDKEWREQLSSDIKQKSSRYVESELTSREFETFLLEAWNRELQGLPLANWINGVWQQ